MFRNIYYIIIKPKMIMINDNKDNYRYEILV